MKDEKEKPYPAGHNWEGLTPSQVNEGYDRMTEEKPISVVEYLQDKLEKGELNEEIEIQINAKPRLGMSSVGIEIGETIKKVLEKEEVKEDD